MIVVSNTTPIISLSSIGKVDLLEQIFGKIIIPKAVYNEIKQKYSYGFDDIDKSFLRLKKFQNQNT